MPKKTNAIEATNQIFVKSMEKQADGGVQLLVSMPGDVTIIIPEAAIANRISLYGLDSAGDAILAILKEHCQRINGLPEVEHPNPKIRKAGGHRADIEVRFA